MWRSTSTSSRYHRSSVFTANEVTHVMQARTDAVRLRGGSQTDLLRQLCEGLAQRPLGDPGAAFGKEEGRDERMGAEAVAMSCIAG